MNTYEVLKRPIITEKNTAQLALNKYTFEVARDATKIEIQHAVEIIFKVDVTDVNVANVRGKRRRFGRRVGMTAPWRKAVVSVQQGQRIELFEGV